MASILIPFFGDQPFRANRVEQLGVGVGTLHRKRLTADQLATAITKVTNDIQLRARAAQLGECIRAEDGVDEAVAIVERAIRRPHDYALEVFLPQAAR